MKFIIDEKIYDTEKSEKICEVTDEVKTDNNTLRQCFVKKKVELYKTQKEHWFIVFEEDGIKKAKKRTEDKVKELLIRNNLVDIYTEQFGDLEEG